MPIVANLTALLKLDTTGFQGGLQAAIRSVQKFNRKLTFASRDIQSAGANISALSAPIALLGVTSVKAAADAEEAGSKFAFTFRDVSDSASRMSQSIAKEFDLASSTTEKLLGDTGDLLSGFGFTQERALELASTVARLGGDLSSFQNVEGGVAGATERLTKGILGQTENLKAMGIVVQQTTPEFKNLIKNLMETEGLELKQAKAIAILNIATKQSKNAIGDYARTSGSLSNRLKALSEQFKDIKVSIGEFLIEGLDLPKVMKAIGDRLKQVINFVKQATPQIKKFFSFLALGVVVAGPLLAALGAIGLSVAGVVAGVTALASALAAMITPVGAIIAGIVALGVVIIKVFDINLKKAFMTFLGFMVNIKENWKILSKFIQDTWRAVWDNFPKIMNTVGLNLIANIEVLAQKIAAVFGAIATFISLNWEVTLGKILNAIIEFAVKALDKFFELGAGIGKVLFDAITAALKGRAAVKEAITKGVVEGLAIGFRSGLKKPTIKGAIKDALGRTSDFVPLLKGLGGIFPTFSGFITSFVSASKAIVDQQKKGPGPGGGKDPATAVADAAIGSIAGLTRGSVEAFRVRAGVGKTEKQTEQNTRVTAEGVNALVSLVRQSTGVEIIVDIP